MAFLGYTRLVVSGTIRGTQGWSVGLSFLTPTPNSNSELFTWLGTVDGLTNTWLTATPIKPVFWDTNTAYNRLTAYQYQAVGGASAQAQIFTTAVTGSNATACPSQLSAVYSIRSGLGGRRDRGRLYIPVTGQSASAATGQLATGNVGNAAANFKTYVDALNLTTIGGNAIRFGIASRASGFTIAAQDVRIDSKIDTQRRRTDKILANNTSISVFA